MRATLDELPEIAAIVREATLEAQEFLRSGALQASVIDRNEAIDDAREYLRLARSLAHDQLPNVGAAVVCDNIDAALVAASVEDMLVEVGNVLTTLSIGGLE